MREMVVDQTANLKSLKKGEKRRKNGRDGG
jgi:hypothetical protein